jgi:hypothetical protein
MIYQQVEAKSINRTLPLKNRLDTIAVFITNLEAGVKVEDSKRREAEMREEIKGYVKEQRKLYGEIYAIQEDVFKDLLAEEYGLPRAHPKFSAVYSLAYSYGHSYGYSEIENHFTDFVELVK